MPENKMITGNARMYKHCATALGTAVLILAAWPSNRVLAQEEDEVDYDAGTRNCIQLVQLRRTHVIDNRNILFYMRGRKVYHVILPAECPGLARENRFGYQSFGRRLCSYDDIQVLYNDPLGMRNGARCELGVFHEITREEADAYRDAIDAQPEPQPLPMPGPEEVGTGNDADDEEPGDTDPGD